MADRTFPAPLDYEPHLHESLAQPDRMFVVLYNHDYERWFAACRADTYYSALNVMNMARNRHRLAMIQRQAAERQALHLRHLAERKRPR